MNQVFLYTFPQWIIFAGLFMIIYGWIEKKKTLRLAGIASFILLGFFALWIISSGKLATSALEETIESSTGRKLFPAYLSFLFSAMLAIPALLLDRKNRKYARLFIVLSAFAGLSGFFVIVNFLHQ